MSALLVVFLMVVLVLIGMPVVFAIGLSSLLFLLFFTHVPLTVVAQTLYNGADSFTLLSVPLFILTGLLMNATSLSQRLVDFASALVGWFRGGLAAVNIATSMLFAGISGTSMADTAAVGGVLIPAMKKKGYSAPFSAAVTASSSTIGIIIPPSVPMILYAVFVGISVTKLFFAGLIPGILIGLGLTVVSTIISIRRGYGKEKRFSIKRVFVTGWLSIPVLLLPIIILGGILSGIFTPTEAAGVATIYTLVLGVLRRELRGRTIYQAAIQTAIYSGSVLLIIVTAQLAAWVFAYSQLPTLLIGPILHLTSDPETFLWLASLIFIIAGTFLHGTAMLIIVVPLLLPVASQLSIEPFQFAMVTIICWGIGQQTPPVGSALFITCSLAKVDMWTLTRANLPFIAVMLVILALVIYWPSAMVLAIPSLIH